MKKNGPELHKPTWDIRLVEFINKHFSSPLNLSELDKAKRSIKAYQDWEYAEIKRISPEFGLYWDLKGKAILDIGCGLGGKTIFYAQQGARSVIGVDIRPTSTLSAFQLARSLGLEKIRPITADAAKLPFPKDTYDIIISINVFEHLDQPLQTLMECKRVLRPGGLILLHFPPFYSPWGAHVENWINFPWPHLFFSDKTLIAVAKRVENHSSRNQSYISQAQVQWEGLESLPELNRLTIGKFLKIIDTADLQIVDSKMLPVGRDFLKNYGRLGINFLGFLKFVVKLPIIREIITTKMLFVLTKE